MVVLGVDDGVVISDKDGAAGQIWLRSQIISSQVNRLHLDTPAVERGILVRNG